MLGHAPDAFWRMTPRELAHAIKILAEGPPPAPGRGDLAALMAAFPDQSRKNRDG